MKILKRLNIVKAVTENPFRVGDILCCEWGYTQQLVDFYKVIATTNSFVQLVALEEKRVSQDDYGQEGKVIPSDKVRKDSYVDNKKFKVKFHGNVPYISINSSITPVEKWDGKPKYFNLYD